ncbi:hypothetical protein [Streptomyces cellostaticus]|uniref:hypothetical protein n=1 Tax=Streptomyces cellostaticus TaxID=67285 RepID=UPI00099E96B7|nr:hypothetical protein [Streptomyces cellostaticus]GHI03575.1 hypothetical protein Scel_18960 [Streptomyces cellostaticus]
MDLRPGKRPQHQEEPDLATPRQVLTVPSAFLNALKDGTRVKLTFHFWSGTTATYYVTKSGTSVTGTTA